MIATIRWTLFTLALLVPALAAADLLPEADPLMACEGKSSGDDCIVFTMDLYFTGSCMMSSCPDDMNMQCLVCVETGTTTGDSSTTSSSTTTSTTTSTSTSTSTSSPTTSSSTTSSSSSSSGGLSTSGDIEGPFGCQGDSSARCEAPSSSDGEQTSSGCGCRSDAEAGWLALLGPLLVLRRRR